MKNDYSALDARLIELIGSGKSNFAQLVPDCEELAKPFCALTMGLEPWRIVDRRLQALRKARKVTYVSAKVGWARCNPDGSIVQHGGSLL